MEGQASFSRPRRSASEQLAGAAESYCPPQPFQPLPPPAGEPPFRLELESVVGSEAVAAIEKAGVLVFHTVGDTGGVKSPQSQEIVTMWMERDFGAHAPPPHPTFFYHLGDVFYYDGERSRYYDEFYEPYLHYPAPIFAIPGNHDGDLGIPPVGSSLDGFMVNFCATEAVVTPDAGDARRPAMMQPNCQVSTRRCRARRNRGHTARSRRSTSSRSRCRRGSDDAADQGVRSRPGRLR
jgi:hypothetical protein